MVMQDELMSELKKPPFFGGCTKWWASACYLRTNVDKLKELTDKIKNLTQNKKYDTIVTVLND